MLHLPLNKSKWLPPKQLSGYTKILKTRSSYSHEESIPFQTNQSKFQSNDRRGICKFSFRISKYFSSQVKNRLRLGGEEEKVML